MRMRIVVIVGILVAGCHGSSVDVTINADDIVGCRAPSEDGCDRCCLQSDAYAPNGNGWVIQDSFGTNQYVGTGIDANNICPSGGLPQCARCSLRNEDDLRSLAAHPVCECDGVDIGTDPCEEANSCECYCQNLDTLLAACSD